MFIFDNCVYIINQFFAVYNHIAGDCFFTSPFVDSECGQIVYITVVIACKKHQTVFGECFCATLTFAYIYIMYITFITIEGL